MRSFLIKSFLLITFAAAPILLTNWIIDPIQFYRKSTLYKPALFKDQRFQNPGLAKNMAYNAVILGTSMSENFRSHEVDSLFQCHSLKLTMSGSSLHEQRLLLQISLKKKPKLVFWGIESHTLNSDPFKIVQDDRFTFPSYLYDDNWLNDFRYLFNNTMFKRSISIIDKSIYRQYKDADEIGRWGDDPTIFSKDTVYKFFNNKKTLSKAEAFVGMEKKQDITDGLKNIDLNIVNIIKNYPMTKFYIFFTSPSILLQYQSLKNASLKSKLELRKYLVKKVGSLKNAYIFDFESDSSIVMNLDNYKDLFHYRPYINSTILKKIRAGEETCDSVSIEKKNSQINKMATNYKTEF